MNEVMKKDAPTGVVVHPSGRTLGNWVVQGLIDLLEGRGGLTYLEQRIQPLASVYAPLAPLRAKISQEKLQYEILIKVADVSASEHATIKRSVKTIEGALGFQEAMDELGSFGIPSSDMISEPLVAAHLAFKHYKACAVASLDALATAYRWIGSVFHQDAVTLNRCEKGSQVLTHLELVLYELRHPHENRIEDTSLMQAIGVCAYALAHKKIQREDAVRLVSATVDAMAWTIISTQIDPAWASVSADATEHFMQEWSRTFGVAAQFLLAS